MPKYADIRAARRVFRVNEGILQLFIFKTELLVLIYDGGSRFRMRSGI